MLHRTRSVCLLHARTRIAHSLLAPSVRIATPICAPPHRACAAAHFSSKATPSTPTQHHASTSPPPSSATSEADDPSMFEPVAPARTPAPPASTSSNEPPPIVLPRWLERFISWVRGGSGTLSHFHARRLYNFVRAHPLATPTPKELAEILRKREIERKKDPLSVADTHPAAAVRSLGFVSNEQTRFRMIALHMWMLQKMMLTGLSGAAAQEQFLHGMRARGDGPNGLSKEFLASCAPNAHQARLIENLFETFWLELTPYLKETRGEVMITKTLRETQAYFYGCWWSLDQAWIHSKLEERPRYREQVVLEPGTGVDAIAASLWVNFYQSDPNVSKREVYRLLYYIQVQMEALQRSAPGDQMWSPKHIEQLAWQRHGVLLAKSSRSDTIMSQRLGVAPSTWQNANFEAWKEFEKEKFVHNPRIAK